jgi:hypothetical protein
MFDSNLPPAQTQEPNELIRLIVELTTPTESS